MGFMSIMSSTASLALTIEASSYVVETFVSSMSPSVLTSMMMMWEITLKKILNYSISDYYDVDWEGDTDDRKSQTRLLIYLGESLVAWSSQNKIQKPAQVQNKNTKLLL